MSPTIPGRRKSDARHDLFARAMTGADSAFCRRPWLIHPLVLYCVPWLLIAPLYSLEWSRVLIYSADTVMGVTLAWIVVPILLSWLYWRFLALRAMTVVSPEKPNFERLLFIARLLLVAWFAASCFEVVTEHGVPLLWFIRGEDKTVQDFGIPSIHGLVNSFLLAGTTIYVLAAVVLRRRRYYLFLAMALGWSVVVVSRELMMVLTVQTTMIFMQHRKVNVGKLLFWGLGLAAAVLLIFGLIGDFRSPLFVKNTAGITEAYPKWLPSGFIWIYMYATTPLNNLIHTILHAAPVYDWSFPNTLQELFPSAVRYIVFPNLDRWSGAGGSLVTQAFNVSSAYVGPVQDFGLLGAVVFAWLTVGGLVYFWKRRDVLGSLGYALFGQCAFFSIFFNHFFYLPVIFQLIWFLIAAERLDQQRLVVVPSSAPPEPVEVALP